jgi:hypothetical protein
VVVREDSAANGETVVLGFDHDPRDFVPEDVGHFLVHVPRHELAATESAGFSTDEEASRWASRHGLRDDFDLSIADVLGEVVHWGRVRLGGSGYGSIRLLDIVYAEETQDGAGQRVPRSHWERVAVATPRYFARTA